MEAARDAHSCHAFGSFSTGCAAMIGASVSAGVASALLMTGAYVAGDLYARCPGRQRVHTVAVALAGASATAGIVFAAAVGDILVIAGTLAFVTLAIRTLNRSLSQVDAGRSPSWNENDNGVPGASTTRESSPRPPDTRKE
jgi:hypothetical protein